MTRKHTAARPKTRDAFSFEYHAEISSTNDRALELARDGAPGKTVVFTDFQSAGRGRRGAVWTAPAESSALFSLIVRPSTPLPPHHLAIITGVGIASGLRKYSPDIKIKWPNDIMLQDRKIAGILVETAADVVVIGVGINCNVPEEAFPEEIRHRAGSLHALTGREIVREQVMTAALQGLTDALARVEAGGIIKVLLEWNTLNWLSRRKVRVTGPLGVVEGDGLFLDGRRLVFHVFKNGGVVEMPLSSTTEAR